MQKYGDSLYLRRPLCEYLYSCTNIAIEQILEMSADAHIERRLTFPDSPDFQRLSGTITAYGKVLTLLVALQEREEFYAMIAQLNLPASVTGLAH